MATRPAAILLATMALLASAGVAAAAQSKLTARPPVSLPVVSATTESHDSGVRPTSHALPKTGIDVRVLIAVGIALLCTGGAVRLGVPARR